ncbi:MAG: type VI secretion system baseplate subunit TssK [Myxococcales bacterium]|nr:type VI secretion system baseplate subunit TssK [Myxococcales bacterium]
MNTRPEPSVLFREGMLLCPQHLQAFSREVRSRLARGDAVGLAGAYGLLSIEVDGEALGRDVFQVVACEAVLRDWSWIRFPELAALPPRDFAKLFLGPSLDVWLGVPAEQPGVPQLGTDPDRAWRYQVLTQTVADENERDSGRELDFRQLQARLFFGEEDRSGFECLRIARLLRRGKPVPKSVLDNDDIPALLACGASAPLMRELKKLSEGARAQARDLAAQLPATSNLSSVDKAADLAAFVKLQAVDRCVALLEQTAGLPQLHPYETWRTLVDLVGTLAIFGSERIPPVLPVYDQEKLGEAFQAAIAALRSLLATEVTVPYETLTFQADAVREGFFQSDVPPEWLEGRSLLYMCVEAPKPAQEVLEFVTNCVKLISADDIERFLTGVVPGIELTYERVPPVVFPKSADKHYFRIQTEGASRDAWVQVEKQKKLALLTFMSSIGTARFHLYVELRR